MSKDVPRSVYREEQFKILLVAFSRMILIIFYKT